MTRIQNSIVEISTSEKDYGAFLTVTDVATLLKVSRPVVDRMLKCGRLPGVKLGGQYRIRCDDFMKWWDHEVKQEQKNILKMVA